MYTIDSTIVNMLPSPPPPSRDPIILPDYPIRPDFEFLTDSSTREMIESAYKAIARVEGWHLLHHFRDDSFMFTNDPHMNDLMTHVNNEYSGGHSGSSMGCTMRHMEYIAKNGFNRYREYMTGSRRWADLQPMVTQPMVTQPMVTQPMVTQPMVTQPMVTQPSVPISPCYLPQ